MTRKQFTLVLLSLALIGGACLVLLNRSKELWAVRDSNVGGKLLPNFRFNDVAAIHIKGSSDLNLVRENGVWRVKERGDYPANFHQIGDLLLKIKDLKVVQSETVGPSQLTGVDLGEPGAGAGGGTLLEFKDARGKLLDALLLGKKHARQQDPSVPPGFRGLYDGRYVLLPGGSRNVLLISDELGSVAPNPEPWLSRDFFELQNMRSIARISSTAAESWNLSRDTESSPWTLADRKSDGSEALDAAVASEITELFRFFNFVDVVPGTVTAAAGSNNPAVLTVLTFDHFAYTLKISPRGSDGNYLLAVTVGADFPSENIASPAGNLEQPKSSEQEYSNTTKAREKLAREKELAGWIYVVEPHIIEVLLRDRAHLLEKKSLAEAK
jgi:hypothetical protein